MARTLPGLICLIIAAGTLPAADQTQLDYSPVVFTVMAAYDVAHATAENVPADPLRAAVRAQVLARKPQVLPELRQYFYDHRRPDPGADLSQYLSFALVAGDVPDFKLRLSGVDVPPDVQTLTGFDGLMAKFYAQAGIAELWKSAAPAYEKTLEQFHEPVSRTLLESSAYLRNPTSGYMGRHFQVFVDLLVPSGQVETRSYKDDYFVVVAPPASARIGDIRHAWLHFLLDPLVTKYAEKFQRVRGLLDYAQGAGALDESYKADFLLLATESLIKAAEARLVHQPSLAQQAVREGYVLTPYFAEHLPLYEKQEAAMRLYLPEMVDAIDLRKEDKRLQTVQFLTEKPVRKVKVEKPPEPVQSPADRALQAADKLYSARDLDSAREAYLKLVRQEDDKSIHARAYFGLGRVAALKNEPELAEQLFRKTLELSPDPHTRSWTEVFLGRLAEGYGEKDQAVEHYRAALQVEGAPPGARQAAEQGVQKVQSR